MRLVTCLLTVSVYVLLFSGLLSAQSSQPRLVNLSGTFRPADGMPPAASETVTVSVYADDVGGMPLWQETQTIAVDPNGAYSLLLGATQADGVPRAVFASGDAHWWSIQFVRPGEVEGPRVRITSVPYALRATDAETLGGRPASAYLLSPAAGGEQAATGEQSTTTAGAIDILAVNPGTTNFVAKYVNANDVGNSNIWESGGRVGINTGGGASDYLHVKFDDPFGAFTGLAVQNTNAGPNAASGMIFLDQAGNVAQFQGFNNSSHVYAINNIAANGSINFLLNSASKFRVAPGGNVEAAGNVTLGSAAINNTALTIRGPNEPENANSAQDIRFAFAAAGSAAIRSHRGNSWDTYLGFLTNHYDQGSDTPQVRMVINDRGNVGIGTTAPNERLDVIQPTPNTWTSYMATSNVPAGQSFGLVLAAGTNTQDAAFEARNQAGTKSMLYVRGDGNVGIGTTNPSRGALEITRVPGVSTDISIPFAYLSYDGVHELECEPGACSAIPVAPSLYATGNLVAPAFLAFSDARAKRIAGRSDAARDLATLAGIEVTDYTYTDTVAKGRAPHKKAIAQQVEQVYPQAVSRSTDIVPDIYRKARITDGWILLTSDLKPGERVRLIGKQTDAVHQVLEVAEGRFRTAFVTEGDEVFVYGREVDDFRTVDYEAIAMLNVSATQELHRRLDAQTGQLSALVTRLTELEQEREQQAVAMATLRQQLADLQASVRAMGEASGPRAAIGK